MYVEQIQSVINFNIIRGDRGTPIMAATYEPRKFKPIQPKPYLNEIIIILHIIRHQ